MAKREKTAEERAEELRLDALGMKPGDQNQTPGEALRPMLVEVERLVALHDVRTILDPFAGTGGLLDGLDRHFRQPESKHLRPSFVGFEIDKTMQEQCDETGFACELQDSLAIDWSFPGQMVVTNPPFSRAAECVKHAVAQAQLVVMLLRLDFLGSQGRAGMHRLLRPAVYVLPHRPSFTGDGKSDQYNCGWFVWGDEQTAGRWWILED